MKGLYRTGGGLIAGVLVLLMVSGCSMLGIKNIPVEKLEKKYFNEHSQMLEFQGLKIHYRDEGQGPVLILIHGVCASLHTWDGWVEELKDHYRIIRVDLPGFGLSPLTDKNIYERQRAVAVIEEMVKTMGLDRFSIAGNSLGGHVAWIYTHAHPERVEKLILIDSAGFQMKMPWILKFASTWPVSMVSRRMMPKVILYEAVNQVYGDPRRMEKGTRERYFELAMRKGAKSDYVDIFKKLDHELSKRSVSDGIDEISVPTLVMWGDKDTWIPYAESIARWRHALPDARFIVYAGAGHVPMEEIPVETARDARAFLSGRITGARAD
ncbi:alpha/beta fold hydrolase [Desulfosudis oleivorans]|uniref:Alpha/beta hydrolase fold n=1 Tax=Desulfosudis oleivorans (strain DSM 6200 / JCM 39069 / Hxd3) TaxID=96561 RepID=A9A0U9_DESOH|nr:alpha/beta hydrolase [Desulfosudis oleivorans]ABW67574.1 alpha/beta hydrolase fold [Desulfosudis oleivorans Hxd3]